MGFYTEIVRMQAEKVRRRGLGADGDKLLQYIARNGPEPGPPAHSRTPPPHPLGREGAGIPPPPPGGGTDPQFCGREAVPQRRRRTRGCSGC